MQIEEVRAKLGEAFQLTHYPSVTSTNDLAMQLARDGAPGGALISADFQTAGRGRRGATWVAPADTSVLLSWLVRATPLLPPSQWAILTGVGVAEALCALGFAAKIKWPNDILVDERKVAGILVETHGDAAVIGVGVNCTVPEEAFPEELRARAGSLHALAGHDIRREEVLVAVARQLAAVQAEVTGGHLLRVLYRWNKLNWYAQRAVRVSGPFGVVEGDGLFLEGRKLMWHVFKDCGVISMPLGSTVEAR